MTCLLFGFAAAGNGAEESPENIEGTTKVSADEFLNLLDQYHELIVIDARVANDRRQGFIEESISLPDIETDCESLSVIAPSKSARILFYCNGPKCGRSAKSVNKAIACGYTKTYWFRGGYEEWLAKDYPVLKP